MRGVLNVNSFDPNLVVTRDFASGTAYAPEPKIES